MTYRHQQLHVPNISQSDFEKFTPDQRFWHHIQYAEKLKKAYAVRYEELTNVSEYLKYKAYRSEAEVERRTRLADLRIEGVDRVSTALMEAAKVFGNNARFDVRTDGPKLWYRARNPSAERMMQRIEAIYMELELQRG